MPTASETRNRIFNDFIDRPEAETGKRIPTIRALAARYGVSAPTVGRAVEILSSQGWLRKRQGSGTFVADTPRSRVTDHTLQPSRPSRPRIGYVSVNFCQPLAHSLLAGLEREATRYGRSLVIASSGTDYDEEQRQVARLIDDGVEGVVLYPTARPENAGEYLARDFRDVPIVVVDLYQPAMQRPHIIFDNVSAGREMTRNLIQRGHDRIGFVTFDLHYAYRSLDDRLEGYRRGLSDHHIHVDPSLIVSTGIPTPHESPNLQRLIDDLAAAGATAIMFPHDFTVEAAIRTTDLLDRSRRGELDFVGFDNVQSIPGVNWPTTEPNFARMGELAADIICSDAKTTQVERILACPIRGPEVLHGVDPQPFPSISPPRRRSRLVATAI